MQCARGTVALTSKTLTRAQAIKYLRLEDKQFDNYFKNAAEFKPLPRRGRRRYVFSRRELRKWKDGFQERMVLLSQSSYRKCLDFALAMYYRGYVPADWSTGRQREFGQLVSNWVKGQLGEIAVGKFSRKTLGVRLKLDFGVYEHIVPQDVLGISRHCRMRKPNLRIAIKATKPKNSFLILSPNEVERKERKSDVYVLVRVDLPDDHLVRVAYRRMVGLLRRGEHFSKYNEQLGSLKKIPCEVCGFAWRKELRRVKKIPGQRFTGIRYVIESGRLHRDRADWLKILT
jgi:hypothetical protein